jgi:hypothetical protein
LPGGREKALGSSEEVVILLLGLLFQPFECPVTALDNIKQFAILFIEFGCRLLIFHDLWPTNMTVPINIVQTHPWRVIG